MMRCLKKLSKDDIFNALCAVFFAEEVRLQDKVSDIETRMRQRGADPYTMLELNQAHACLDYFRTYIMSVLNFLKNFDR